MRGNSWLYHYYSVQSKLTLGLQFDNPRMTPNSYYPYQSQTIPPQMPPYQLHHQGYEMPPMGNSHIPNHHCDYSTIPLSPNAHSQHSVEMNEAAKTTVNHKDGIPVDYSQHQQDQLHKTSPIHDTEKKEHFKIKEKIKKANESGDINNDKAIKKEDYGKSLKAASKKYTFKRIESLHISDGNMEPPTDNHSPIISDSSNEHVSSVMDNGDNRDVHTVYLNSTIHSRSRISKAFSSSLPILPHPIESSEMEQWNPSPTWSDSNIQKVPDIIHQQLSPYLITTPPTPISASHHHGVTHSGTFTFDWVPEQYVPTSQVQDDRNEQLHMSPQRCLQNRMPVMSIQNEENHKEEGSEVGFSRFYSNF